jgi:putative transposase
MSTFTQIYYHLVFSTKGRERVLIEEHRKEFFRYTWGIVRNKDSHLYRINAVEDHVHILTSLHPSVAFADFVKDIKVATSVWIKEKGLFPGFQSWQEGYGGFTASHADKDRLIEYIKNQQEHHRVKSFVEELREMLVEAGVEFDEKYLD